MNKFILLILVLFPYINFAQICDVFSFGTEQNGHEYLKTEEKVIYVNVHFMRDLSGQKNFQEFEGDLLVKNLIDNVNYLLSKNEVDARPVGAAGDNILPKFRVELKTQINDPDDPDQDGIYYWNTKYNWARGRMGPLDDDYLQNFTVDQVYSSSRMQPFEKDQVINVFFQERLRDWLPIINGKMSDGVAEGIGNGDGLILYGTYHDYLIDSEVIDGWGLLPTNFIHELGHLFGLSHSVQHYGSAPSEVWCSETEAQSNNYMEYDCARNSFTPHQLFLMHEVIQHKDYLNNVQFPFSSYTNITNQITFDFNEDYPGYFDVETAATLNLDDYDYFWEVNICDTPNDCQTVYFINQVLTLPSTSVYYFNLYLRNKSTNEFFKIEDIQGLTNISPFDILEHLTLNQNIEVSSLPLLHVDGNNYFIEVDPYTLFELEAKDNICPYDLNNIFVLNHYYTYNNGTNTLGIKRQKITYNAEDDWAFTLNPSNGNAASFEFGLQRYDATIDFYSIIFVAKSCSNYYYSTINDIVISDQNTNNFGVPVFDLLYGDHTLEHIVNESSPRRHAYFNYIKNGLDELNTQTRITDFAYNQGSFTSISYIKQPGCLSSVSFEGESNPCSGRAFELSINGNKYQVNGYTVTSNEQIQICSNQPTNLSFTPQWDYVFQEVSLVDENGQTLSNITPTNNSIQLTNVDESIVELKLRFLNTDCSLFVRIPIESIVCVNPPEDECAFNAFPNPMDNHLTISALTFDNAKQTEEIKEVKIIDQVQGIILNQTYPAGKHSVSLNNLNQIPTNKVYSILVEDFAGNTCTQQVSKSSSK